MKSKLPTMKIELNEKECTLLSNALWTLSEDYKYRKERDMLAELSATFFAMAEGIQNNREAEKFSDSSISQ